MDMLLSNIALQSLILSENPFSDKGRYGFIFECAYVFIFECAYVYRYAYAHMYMDTLCSNIALQKLIVSEIPVGDAGRYVFIYECTYMYM